MNSLFNERTTVKTTVEVLQGFDPVIFIDIDALGKMKEYVDGCSDEIGWLGEVVKEGTNYIIKDVHLFEQQVHSTTCEITTEGLTSFANELLMQPDGVEIWNNIKCWFHSHVNMGVSPSAQDNSQMEVFKDCGHDFFIRAIANKKGEMEFTLYDYEQGLIYKNVKWTTMYQKQEIYDIQAQIDALQATMSRLKQPTIDKVGIKTEMAKKVSKISYGVGVKGYNACNNYGMGAQVNCLKDYGSYDDIYNSIDTKKKNVVNEVKSGSSSELTCLENTILIAYQTGDYDILEEIFTIDEILEMPGTNHVALRQLVFDNYGQYIDLENAKMLKEMCVEYQGILYKKWNQ